VNPKSVVCELPCPRYESTLITNIDRLPGLPLALQPIATGKLPMDNTYSCQACRRTFVALHAFNNHQRSCKPSKKRLSSALVKAKEIWTSTKRRRLEHKGADTVVDAIHEMSLPSSFHDMNENIKVNAAESQVRPSPTFVLMLMLTDVIQHDHDQVVMTDLDLPIAQRRPSRQHRLPKRYQDILPQALLNLSDALPPAQLDREEAPQTALSVLPEESSGLPPAPQMSKKQALPVRLFRYIRTPKNTFGLIRQFFAERLPSHDPDDLLSLGDLCNDPTAVAANDSATAQSPATVTPNFFPYPNRSSFLLGDWYWNGRTQKSQDDFKSLLNVITDPDFTATDIRHTKWHHVNEVLASSEADGDEWIDADGGWSTAQVKISIPFHRRTLEPGQREYVGADLHHRSLVDIVKEKLTNQKDFDQFHLEPYRLIWKPSDDHQGMHVHGELYTSQAFLDAHRELQESPGEPDCDLPRVVVALMLWSDSTHLTSFGDAKLWPLYVLFGNESKYRRCKPSCKLCCHAAYFRNV
jgi:hypothetical protein